MLNFQLDSLFEGQITFLVGWEQCSPPRLTYSFNPREFVYNCQISRSMGMTTRRNESHFGD